MTNHATTARGGIEVTCVADRARQGGAEAVLHQFRQLGGERVAAELLREAGFDVARDKHRLTILTIFTRSTRYPTISGIHPDEPFGVRMRFKPIDPDQRGFTLRLAVDERTGASREAVAARLRAAAFRLYGRETTPDAADAAEPTPADLARAEEAVAAMHEYGFVSDDRMVWADGVAKEIGPAERAERWDAVLHALAAAGRVVWVADTGYALPLRPTPSARPTPPSAPPPPAPDQAAGPPPELAAGPPPELAAGPPPELAAGLAAMMAEFAVFQERYNAASHEVSEAGWEVRNARTEREAAERKLADLREAEAKAVARLAAAKAAQAATARAIDPEVLLNMAANLATARAAEAARGEPASGPTGTGSPRT